MNVIASGGVLTVFIILKCNLIRSKIGSCQWSLTGGGCIALAK